MNKEEIANQILDKPSDEKINDLAEFFQGLNIHQLLFLKDSYEEWLTTQAREVGNGLVH